MAYLARRQRAQEEEAEQEAENRGPQVVVFDMNTQTGRFASQDVASTNLSGNLAGIGEGKAPRPPITLSPSVRDTLPQVIVMPDDTVELAFKARSCGGPVRQPSESDLRRSMALASLAAPLGPPLHAVPEAAAENLPEAGEEEEAAGVGGAAPAALRHVPFESPFTAGGPPWNGGVQGATDAEMSMYGYGRPPAAHDQVSELEMAEAGSSSGRGAASSGAGASVASGTSLAGTASGNGRAGRRGWRARLQGDGEASGGRAGEAVATEEWRGEEELGTVVSSAQKSKLLFLRVDVNL